MYLEYPNVIIGFHYIFLQTADEKRYSYELKYLKLASEVDSLETKYSAASKNSDIEVLSNDKEWVRFTDGANCKYNH